jgi:hypothetical protein
MIADSAGDRSAHRWSVAAFVLALCASIALLVLPICEQGSESSVTDAAGEVTRASASTQETLLQADGFGWIAILAVPVVVTALPLLLSGNARIRTLRIIVAIVLLLILPIGYFTIGGFYLPSAVAMLIAATRPDARRPQAG